jgi:hypothetical protein
VKKHHPRGTALRVTIGTRTHSARYVEPRRGGWHAVWLAGSDTRAMRCVRWSAIEVVADDDVGRVMGELVEQRREGR